MENLEEIKKIFEKDVFATKQADCCILEAEKCHSKIAMKIGDNHLNANGFVMGGAIYTLADFAFAVASNTHNKLTVTTCGSIDYLSAVSTDLIAEARVIKDGRTSVLYQVDIFDTANKLIAVATFRGQKCN